MKHMKKVSVLCIIILISYTTKAQVTAASRQNRQNEFSKFSDKVPTPQTELDKAFLAPEGTKIQLNFSNFLFTGIVTSSLKRYDNLYSVIIKSSSLDNTLFAISKRINDDKTITYVGRIINEKYADGYELRKESDGTYALNKIKTQTLIEDY